MVIIVASNSSEEAQVHGHKLAMTPSKQTQSPGLQFLLSRASRHPSLEGLGPSERVGVRCRACKRREVANISFYVAVVSNELQIALLWNV